MELLQIFTALCIFTIVACIVTMVDWYPVHNKQTNKVETWISYWSVTN